MRRAGELIAYRPDGAREHYYPLWQFDEEWQPLPIIPQLVREARGPRPARQPALPIAERTRWDRERQAGSARASAKAASTTFSRQSGRQAPRPPPLDGSRRAPRAPTARLRPPSPRRLSPRSPRVASPCASRPRRPRARRGSTPGPTSATVSPSTSTASTPSSRRKSSFPGSPCSVSVSSTSSRFGFDAAPLRMIVPASSRSSADLDLRHEGCRVLVAPGRVLAVGLAIPLLEVDQARLLGELPLVVVDPVPRERARRRRAACSDEPSALIVSANVVQAIAELIRK